MADAEESGHEPTTLLEVCKARERAEGFSPSEYSSLDVDSLMGLRVKEVASPSYALDRPVVVPGDHVQPADPIHLRPMLFD